MWVTRKHGCATACVCLVMACSGPEGDLAAQSSEPEVIEAAETITARDLRRHVGALAHDSMRGRNTPSPELEQAADYIAAELALIGVRPGTADDWEQRYPLTFIRPGAPENQRMVLTGPDGAIEFDPEDGFVPVPAGAQLEGEGRLVALDGMEGSEDVGGSIALLGVGQAQMGRVLSSVRRVLDRRANGVIVAVDGSRAYVNGLRRFFRREQMALGEPDALGAPVVLVAQEALPAAVRTAIREGGAVVGYSAALRSDADVRRAEGVNVVGWIQGSDPELRDEYVVFTAHMDHVGVGRPVAGDSIFNGADDDASGTSAILEIAEAFAALPEPTRRSLVFMTVSGEEKGLLGSQWYAEHPVFPLETTVANLNIDMIGRNWRDTVVAIGQDESSLGEVLRANAAAHPDLGLTVIDDPWPEERFYFRSDHYNFARSGVPILFFFTGTHEDYHRPSDEPDRLLYEKTARIARLIFYVGYDVAQSDDAPEWDEAAYRRVVEGGG